MCNIVVIANNTVFHIWKLLGGRILKVLNIKGKKKKHLATVLKKNLLEGKIQSTEKWTKINFWKGKKFLEMYNKPVFF